VVVAILDEISIRKRAWVQAGGDPRECGESVVAIAMLERVCVLPRQGLADAEEDGATSCIEGISHASVLIPDLHVIYLQFSLVLLCH
jgi:hypothetical protein